MSRWYRAYEGTVNDVKLAEAAMVADVSRAVSIAAWHALLESAAAVNNCGSFGVTPRQVSIILCEPPAAVEALFAAYAEIGLIGDGVILSWRKRQFQSDDSKDRVAKHRAKKRQETAESDADDSAVTPCNGAVTPSKAETETEPEKEVSSDDDSASGNAPSLQPEHVRDYWNEVAPTMARPCIRDLTPERRQLVKARIAQYSLEDFQTVFAKCRDSPFLRGDKGRTPLTFDWIMKKGNFQKTLEGNYDR